MCLCFHPPLRGVLYCPRSGYKLPGECAFAFILRWEVSCTVRGQGMNCLENAPLLSSPVERCLVLSAVRVWTPWRMCLCFHPPLRGVLYCPRSGYELCLENVPLLSSSVERCLVLSAVRVWTAWRMCLCFHPPLGSVLYCPRSGYELPAGCSYPDRVQVHPTV
jgi:hypothetical protein